LLPDYFGLDEHELSTNRFGCAEDPNCIFVLAPRCQSSRQDCQTLRDVSGRSNLDREGQRLFHQWKRCFSEPALVPAIWLPDPRVRAERERARWRLHLVRHRSSLKQRVHAVLLTHGKLCPVSDLFGVRGRRLLANLGLPEPWQACCEISTARPTYSESETFVLASRCRLRPPVSRKVNKIGQS
jgi:hypothetical protein